MYLVPGWIGIWECWSLRSGKTRVPREKPLGVRREPTWNSTPTHGIDPRICLSHTGRRWVLSPLHHPFLPPDVRVTDEIILFMKNVDYHYMLFIEHQLWCKNMIEMTGPSGDWYSVLLCRQKKASIITLMWKISYLIENYKAITMAFITPDQNWEIRYVQTELIYYIKMFRIAKVWVYSYKMDIHSKTMLYRWSDI